MNRRVDDQPTSLMREGFVWNAPDAPAEQQPPQVVLAAPLPEPESAPGTVLLLRTGPGGDEVLVAGTAVRRVDSDLPGDQAARAMAVWRDEWLRLRRRSELPEKLIAFFDDLHLAETPQAVCDRVAQHAVRAVGGYDARVFLLPTPANDPDDERWGELSDGSTLAEARFARAGLMIAEDAPAEVRQWLEGMQRPGSNQVVLLAHVPFGQQGVLLLAERRGDRVFDADDWAVFGTLAEQGSRALERALWLQQIEEISLTDPLTGLANRRQMEVVLGHAWAAAERGDGLAVLMLDLDGFKEINDRYGHPVGDQILSIVAEALRKEARGADAVVRYGGDEFLVVMPRANASGARALAARVKRALEGWVGVSAGVAEYHPSYASSAELILAADSDLYRSKDRRARELPSGDEEPRRLPNAG